VHELSTAKSSLSSIPTPTGVKGPSANFICQGLPHKLQEGEESEGARERQSRRERNEKEVKQKTMKMERKENKSLCNLRERDCFGVEGKFPSCVWAKTQRIQGFGVRFKRTSGEEIEVHALEKTPRTLRSSKTPRISLKPHSLSHTIPPCLQP
uniref:Uncharacterized protein n=1 Tax=Myripristis murdjan TaxID=586833 RepID=A0A667WP49_9TELE